MSLPSRTAVVTKACGKPVWERLGKRMAAELEPDSAWVVDDTGFPKQGDHSVGVARQYSGALGKTANCQVAVSIHLVSENGNVPLDWRLYLPESWTQDQQRRREAGIPGEIAFRTKGQLALEIIDQIRGWGLPDRNGNCPIWLAWGRRWEFGSNLRRTRN